VAAARGLRPEPGSGIRRRRLSGGRRGSAQLLFDSLAEVLDQMKAVSDLPRLRRPPAGSLSIEAAAIPADDLDFRMLAQPTGGRLRRALRQHVDNLAPLQIDHDRSIAGPLSPTPIVDADNLHCRARAAIGRVALEVSQNGIVALWKFQACHQSLCWTPPSGVTDKPAQFSGPASSPGEGSCDLGEPTGESPQLTSSILTLPSSQPDLQRHACPLNRQTLQMLHIPAMPTCRRKIAVGTPRGLQPRGGDHPPSVHTIGAQDLHTRSQSPFRFCCHATSTQFAFCRLSQFRLTQSEEDLLRWDLPCLVKSAVNYFGEPSAGPCTPGRRLNLLTARRVF
jgi:hypothetical protein